MIKNFLKKLVENYLESTTKSCFWMTSGTTFVPWMAGKE